MPFVAIDSENKRVGIEAAERGRNYYCQLCGQKLIIRHGQIRAAHFAHLNPRGKGDYTPCGDRWPYDMSDWHKAWQERFPLECREVVVSSGSEKHIADILINNTVIEFQHSKISADHFKERNDFYTKCGYRVVWVFDFTEEFANDTLRGGMSNEEYLWDHPWSTFTKSRYFPQNDKPAIFFQFRDPPEDCEEGDDWALERIVRAYSDYKTIYSDDDNDIQTIRDFVEAAKRGTLFGKEKEERPLIHQVDGGKRVYDFWKPTYTGIMIRNMATGDVMAINGYHGEMRRECFGRQRIIVGYYCNKDPETGHYKANKTRYYAVKQRDDPVWELLHYFEASKEQIEAWKEEERQRAERIAEEARKKEEEERKLREERRRQREEEAKAFERELELRKQKWLEEAEAREKERQEEAALEAKAIAEAKEIEYKLFLDNLPALLEGDDPVVDPYGHRYFRCGWCGKISVGGDFSENRGNRGTCKDCMNQGLHAGSNFEMPKLTTRRCPLCGKALLKKLGSSGPYYICSGYLECKYQGKEKPKED